MQKEPKKDRVVKLVKSLDLMDDDLFHKVMENREACEEMLRVLLGRDVHIVENNTQENCFHIKTRTVILDLKCVEQDGTIINVEVQKIDQHNYPKRTRYHISSIDTKEFEKGTKFEDIHDIYVVFLMPMDIYKAGHTVYHLDQVVRETSEVVDDGTIRMCINAEVNDGTEIAEFMQYMAHTKTANNKYPSISNMVALCKKENEKEGIEVCDKVEEYGRECREEGREEGRQEILFNLVADNLLTLEQAASKLGATVEKCRQSYDEYLKSK